MCIGKKSFVKKGTKIKVQFQVKNFVMKLLNEELCACKDNDIKNWMENCVK